ncbi:MAG: hypothetical protein K5648_07110 [Erysipelotrichaceae bacterium]|nr:hypothetical protein [Erysipelotrichaceae bacterium]
MKYLILRDEKKLIRALLHKEEPFHYEGIDVYYKKGIPYLSCAKGYVLEDGEKTCRLQEKAYRIESSEGFRSYELFVYPDDHGAQDYGFYENRDLILSSLPDADLKSDDPYLQKGSFILRDGIIDSDLCFSVNEGSYDGFKLKDGDQIAVLGLRIFYYRDFLYINSFHVKNSLPVYEVKEHRLSYPLHKTKTSFFHGKDGNKLTIPELRDYVPYEKKQLQDPWAAVLPGLIMGLSVCLISGLSLYKSQAEGKPLLDSLVYVISPVAMLISMVVLPLLFHRRDRKENEKKEKEVLKDYLIYLDDYEKQLKENISLYAEERKDLYFSLKELYKDPFYLNAEEEDFLCLSLGMHQESHPFAHHSANEVIEKRYRAIAALLKQVGPLPLLLKLREGQDITFLCKKSQKRYFFLRFLLELCYKHSFDDIAVAVYCKDSALISLFYDLPHMFTETERLCFHEERSLLELDQKSQERPLFLFTMEDVPFSFQNKKICVLRFTEEEGKIFKRSDTIVDLAKASGILYGQSRTAFSYVLETCDLKERFHELGSFNMQFMKKDELSFAKLFKDFDIEESYRQKHKDLRCDFAVYEKRLLYFDLHQSAHGPHGLIGGATGSGKSELIISLLLSLCIRYSPEYLNIIVIDYKGSGIIDSLSCENRPAEHIIASVSNLEGNVFERLIIALKNLCRKRQEIFTKFSAKTGLAVFDLDAYLELGPERYGFSKIAHLLIVADEFAELKKEHPEQVKELISIARIGRSLGIHLILATQKPSGCIDEEIWSNCHFKICLKVLEEKDSQDLLHDKAGADLRKPGEFLLKSDHQILSCQSIYAKNDISGNDPYEVGLLNDELKIVNRIKIPSGERESENTYFIRKIREVCEKLSLQTEKIDLHPPVPMARKDLAKGKCIVLGEIDDYIRDRRELLAYSFKEDLLICSSRKKEHHAILNTLNENQRDFIFIGNKRINYEHCAGSYLYEEKQEIFRIYEVLEKEERKLSIVIEDLSVFFSYEEDYSAKLTEVLKKKSENIAFICLSSSAALPYKLMATFKNRISIDISEAGDLSYLYGMKSRYKGKSFALKDELICFIPILEEEMKQGPVICAPLLKEIPSYIRTKIKDGTYLIGIDVQSREEVYHSGRLVIASFDEQRKTVYREAYQAVEVLEASRYGDLPSSFLWIGAGIFYQRYFSPERKEDINENEAIYFCNGKRRLLRCLDGS